MKVTIERMDNGFSVTGPCPEGEGDYTQVFEQATGMEDCSAGALIRAFWAIKDLLGEYGEKYGQHNVTISCEPGRGVDDLIKCRYRR